MAEDSFNEIGLAALFVATWRAICFAFDDKEAFAFEFRHTWDGDTCLFERSSVIPIGCPSLLVNTPFANVTSTESGRLTNSRRRSAALSPGLPGILT